MEVTRIAPEELKQRLDAGEQILVVDARSRQDYDQSHIKGARSLPFKEAEGRLGEFARDSTILCY